MSVYYNAVSRSLPLFWCSRVLSLNEEILQSVYFSFFRDHWHPCLSWVYSVLLCVLATGCRFPQFTVCNQSRLNRKHPQLFCTCHTSSRQNSVIECHIFLYRIRKKFICYLLDKWYLKFYFKIGLAPLLCYQNLPPASLHMMKTPLWK